VAKRGRPSRLLEKWLVHDVELVKKRHNCSILNACGYLSDGDYAEELPVLLPLTINGQVFPRGTKARVTWGQWKGMEILTLERMYYRAKSPKKLT
jgi:hypothetical protein